MRSQKLTHSDGRIVELRDRGDGTYLHVVDGVVTGCGKWLTDAEKAVLQELEYQMLLGNSMVGLDEDGNWESAEKINKHWKLKSKTMGNENKCEAVCKEQPRQSQLEIISELAQELIDQQQSLKDRLESLADRLLGSEPQDPPYTDDRCDNGKLDQIESALRLAMRYGSEGNYATGRLIDQL